MEKKVLATVVATQVSMKLEKKVDVQDVNKGNGVIRTGLIIKEPNGLCPTVYVDDILAANITISEMTDEVIRRYENAPKIEEDLEIQRYSDWSKVKGEIKMSLVNTARNMDVLSKMPHRSMSDLSIIYYVEIIDDGIIKVLNEHLKCWGVTEEDLYEAASKNTAECVSVRKISEVLPLEMLGTPSADLPMLIVSNTKGVQGAAAVLFADVEEIFGEEVVVIPSSVHECICVPKSEAETVVGLAELICEVNTTQLLPTEVLGDHPYTLKGGKLL